MIKGFDSLMKKMYYLGTIADPNQLDEIAKQMEMDAKSNCPTKTGRLKESIKADITKTGKKATLRLYSTVDYAPYVEYGTSKMAARPFLKPAFNQNKNKVVRKIRNNIKKVVK